VFICVSVDYVMSEFLMYLSSFGLIAFSVKADMKQGKIWVGNSSIVAEIEMFDCLML
jgi:hypothetical protein